MLDGYTREGFGWQGDYQATDATLSIKGIDDLYGAIVELEDKLFDAANPPEDAIRAGSIGACYIAVLIHQALRDQVRKHGLPRPLCVLAACDGVYPFFDAPVAGSDECTPAPSSEPAASPNEDDEDEFWPNELEGARPAAEGEPLPEASLLAVHHLRTKTPVLILDEESAAESLRFTELAETQRMFVSDDMDLKGIFHGIPAAELLPEPEEFELELEPEGLEFEAEERAPEAEPGSEPFAEEAWEPLYQVPTAGLIVAPTGRSIRARIHPPRAAVVPAPSRAPHRAFLNWLRQPRAPHRAAFNWLRGLLFW